MIEHLA
jgi:hypothetical protein